MTIEQLEREYTSYGKDIPDYRWGEKEEAELGRRAEALRKAYDAAGTPEFDRVQL